MFPSFSKFEFDMDFDFHSPEWGLEPAAPSEDFWKNFEELPDLGEDLETLLGMNMDLDGLSGRTIEEEQEIELDLSGVLTRNQDPLWAGTTTTPAVSKQPLTPPPKPNPTPPSLGRGSTGRMKKVNAVTRKTTPGVSSTTAAGTALKKQSAQQLLSVPRPETPMSPSDSEQEEEKVDVEKLQASVRLAGNVQIIRRMYPNVKLSGETGPNKRKSVQSGRCSKVAPKYTIAPHMDDHNYEYEKSTSGKTVKLEDLGVVTPSDSEDDQRSSASEEEEEEEEEEDEEEEGGEEDDDEEEEIDVVSLSRDSLPTNPTLEIRRHLQNKVASAITTNTLLSASRAVSKRLNQKRLKRKRANSDDDFDEGEVEIKVEPQDDEDPLCLRGVTVAASSSARSGSLPATPQHSNHYFHYHRSRGTSSASSTPRATTSAASSTASTPRRYVKPHKKSRFSSDSEPSTEKRHMHNNMERMRRVDLRNAFEDLRELIPNLMGVQRAAKVSILKDATSYLYELRQKEKALHQQVTAMRGHQDKLRNTLSQLRRSLAAKR